MCTTVACDDQQHLFHRLSVSGLIPHVDSHHSPLRSVPEAQTTTARDFILQHFRRRSISNSNSTPTVTSVPQLKLNREATLYQFNPAFYRHNPTLLDGLVPLIDAFRAIPGVQIPRDVSSGTEQNVQFGT